jgi:serine/threonine protein kinase
MHFLESRSFACACAWSVQLLDAPAAVHRPFLKGVAVSIMYHVARGMDALHKLNIVLRDLKASNVFCSRYSDNNYIFYVVDFEYSNGVVGTGFFRALEILQALKNQVVNKRPNLFTRATDVYSYGMTCYEVLTGKLLRVI